MAVHGPPERLHSPLCSCGAPASQGCVSMCPSLPPSCHLLPRPVTPAGCWSACAACVCASCCLRMRPPVPAPATPCVRACAHPWPPTLCSPCPAGAQRGDHVPGQDPGAPRAPGGVRVREADHLRPAHEQAGPLAAGDHKGGLGCGGPASKSRCSAVMRMLAGLHWPQPCVLQCTTPTVLTTRSRKEDTLPLPPCPCPSPPLPPLPAGPDPGR